MLLFLPSGHKYGVIEKSIIYVCLAGLLQRNQLCNGRYMQKFLMRFWYRIRRNDGTHMSSIYVPYLRKMMLALNTIDNKGMY